ncbi:hypothetical protein DH2020_007879 [Rehmannia glutinosa]|uniref:Serine/threonine-protein kinase RIO1 n=1 Tax=Rehmannia glutinosa TaxID=99300 RepID=A0ABR0TZE5_REHGL
MTTLPVEKVDAGKERGEEDCEELEEEDDLSFSSDSEIGEALDYLDSRDDAEGGIVDSSFTLLHTRRPNAHGGLHSRPNNSSLQPISNKSQKFANHIRAAPLEEWEGRFNVGMSNSVTTAIRESVRDMAIGKTRTTEKADRATVEQAIDPRTRMVLFKMLNRGVFNDINGCISTGKEANVYHATKSDDQELAIKIYKTSVLVFKYVQLSLGFSPSIYSVTCLAKMLVADQRTFMNSEMFRYGYCKHNPRKMVKTWAEKEMRNLMRLRAAGIRCPAPLLLRLHVLVMEFIGKAGWAAPRLKDADLSHDKLRKAMSSSLPETLCCLLFFVPDDYGNANIISKMQASAWRSQRGHLYIIDVSQAVDLDHPHALDFLREDCIHVSDFFRKHGIAAMTIRELFDFIVDPTIDDDSVDSYLEEAQRKIMARGDVISAEEEIADSVFVQSYIPKTLDHVKNAEEDVQRIISGKDTGDMYYQTITGLKKALSMSNSSQPENEQHPCNGKPIKENTFETAKSPGLPDGESETEESEESDDDASDSDEEDSLSESEKQTPADRKAARKENKKKVKEEKRRLGKVKFESREKKKKKKLAKAKKYR